MRQLASYNDQKKATDLGKLLAGSRIPCQMEAAPDQRSWEIWVEDDDQLEQAKNLKARFEENPQAQDLRRVIDNYKAPEKEKVSRHKSVDVRQTWNRPGDSTLPPPLTSGLIIFCIGIFILQIGRANFNIDIESLLWISNSRQGLPEIFNGQIWRLFTPALMHGGFLHIFFNLLWLSQIGSLVERREGTFMFAVMVLSIGIISNIGQFLWSGPRFLGMSGVVFGLLGYVWIRGKYHNPPEYRLDQQLVIFMGIWLILGFTGMIGSIANGAHTIGLLMGVLWATVKLRRIPFTEIKF